MVSVYKEEDNRNSSSESTCDPFDFEEEALPDSQPRSITNKAGKWISFL
jgi:hypothetical protein